MFLVMKIFDWWIDRKIVGNTLGEVMEIGSEDSAFCLSGARFYKERGYSGEKREVPVGTSDIVDFDKKGIAFSGRNHNFIE